MDLQAVESDIFHLSSCPKQRVSIILLKNGEKISGRIDLPSLYPNRIEPTIDENELVNIALANQADEVWIFHNVISLEIRDLSPKSADIHAKSIISALLKDQGLNSRFFSILGDNFNVSGTPNELTVAEY